MTHALSIAETNVLIGGRNLGKDVPNINISRLYESEMERVWLNVNCPLPVSKGAKFETKGKKRLLTLGHERHVYYPIPGGLEYEIWFADRPAKNTVSLDLLFPAGLDFHFQPPLTDAEIREGHVRPENVVGSYAVYWKESGHLIDQDKKTIVNYQAGKFCHIYRPLARDAAGKTVWCDLQIEGGKMRIVLPSAWLKKALYPVVLDPTFGYETIAGTTIAIPTDIMNASGAGTPASSGTTDSLTWYSSAAGTVSVKVGLYNDSTGPTSPVSGSPIENASVASWTAAWKTFAMSGLSVVGGSLYWPTVVHNATITYYYDTLGGTNRYRREPQTYASAWPNPFGSTSSSSAKYSIYVTYTAAGGLSIPVLMNQYRQRWS